MAVYRGKDAEGVFFTPRRDEAKQRDPEYVEVQVPTTQKDLLPFLTALANEDRDVPEREQTEPEPPPPATDVPVRELSHSELRLAFDEAWQENFPLALKLHYAALACEDAREQIKETKT